MSPFHRATFFITAAKLGDLQFASAAEVAFAGRSNAGKSSAINTLANFRRLAFTSKMPGRTQQLNYFALGADRYMVDLPGYGYAKVARTERERWGRFIGSYLQVREPLAGLVLIMDARHPLTELDYQLLEWFGPTGKPVHALLTKSDKLSKLECAATLRKVTADMKALSPLYSASLFSSLKKTGIEDAEAAILPWLNFDDEAMAQIEREKAELRNVVKGKKEAWVEGGNWRDTAAQAAAKESIKAASGYAEKSAEPRTLEGKPPARGARGVGSAAPRQVPAKAGAMPHKNAHKSAHKSAYKNAGQHVASSKGRTGAKSAGRTASATPAARPAVAPKPLRANTRRPKK